MLARSSAVDAARLSYGAAASRRGPESHDHLSKSASYGRRRGLAGDAYAASGDSSGDGIALARIVWRRTPGRLVEFEARGGA